MQELVSEEFIGEAPAKLPERLGGKLHLFLDIERLDEYNWLQDGQMSALVTACLDQNQENTQNAAYVHHEAGNYENWMDHTVNVNMDNRFLTTLLPDRDGTHFVLAALNCDEDVISLYDPLNLHKWEQHREDHVKHLTELFNKVRGVDSQKEYQFETAFIPANMRQKQGDQHVNSGNLCSLYCAILSKYGTIDRQGTVDVDLLKEKTDNFISKITAGNVQDADLENFTLVDCLVEKKQSEHLKKEVTDDGDVQGSEELGWSDGGLEVEPGTLDSREPETTTPLDEGDMAFPEYKPIYPILDPFSREVPIEFSFFVV